jgi:ACR3 family arsenite efflux pump ArsB
LGAGVPLTGAPYRYSLRRGAALVNIFSKLQPLFIILSAFLGILLGKISPGIEQHAGSLIEVFLMIMLFFTFLGVEIKDLAKSFTNLKFSISALLINFLWTPVFAFLLAKIFLPGQVSLQMGFIMLMVTPCTDWYLIFTGLAKGNVALGSSILPLNLIVQIILLPVYLFVFMGQAVSFDMGILIQSILLVLMVPLTSANIAKLIISKIHLGTCFDKIFEKIIEKNDGIQFTLLCCAIISMFASQGSILIANGTVLTKLLFPLILFFVVNFFLSLFTGKRLGMPFQDIIPLIFTTSARNSPISLAIAIITFPSDPVISLVLVMGPLIELPVLAVNASILKRMHGRK